jgi:hypothetical protein
MLYTLLFNSLEHYYPLLWWKGGGRSSNGSFRYLVWGNMLITYNPGKTIETWSLELDFHDRSLVLPSSLHTKYQTTANIVVALNVKMLKFIVSGVMDVAGGQNAQNHRTSKYTHAKMLLMIPKIPGMRHGPQCKLSGRTMAI